MRVFKVICWWKNRQCRGVCRKPVRGEMAGSKNYCGSAGNAIILPNTDSSCDGRFHLFIADELSFCVWTVLARSKGPLNRQIWHQLVIALGFGALLQGRIVIWLIEANIATVGQVFTLVMLEIPVFWCNMGHTRHRTAPYLYNDSDQRNSCYETTDPT